MKKLYYDDTPRTEHEQKRIYDRYSELKKIVESFRNRAYHARFWIIIIMSAVYRSDRWLNNDARTVVTFPVHVLISFLNIQNALAAGSDSDDDAPGSSATSFCF